MLGEPCGAGLFVGNVANAGVVLQRFRLVHQDAQYLSRTYEFICVSSKDSSSRPSAAANFSTLSSEIDVTPRSTWLT